MPGKACKQVEIGKCAGARPMMTLPSKSFWS